MPITIIAIGKVKEAYLREGCAEYAKRLSGYTPITIVEADEYRIGDKPVVKEIETGMHKEAQAILKHIKPADYVIALAIEGKTYSSEDWATHLDILRANQGNIVFVLGGSYGLSPDIKKRADELLSIGPLTFPHQLARLVFLEQLYRAFKIIKGETYHK